ncbi:hypothetical protein BH23ACT12_BH23ACT12_07800 [soil metagenome]
MTWALIVSAALGAGYGALGARLNRVATGDERTLWVSAGLIGGPLALLEYCGMMWLKNLGPGLALPVVPSALVVVTVSGALGAALTPALDESESSGRWALSLGLKWIRSPIATTAGLLAALGTKLRRRPVDFRRGMLFIDVGPGGSALALGAVAWCQNRCFGTQRCTTDALACHEAVHSRTVAAVGELGFYLTYLTAGVLWARIQGGPWNGLTPQGCGQPFEKTAHTYTSDPATGKIPR